MKMISLLSLFLIALYGFQSLASQNARALSLSEIAGQDKEKALDSISSCEPNVLESAEELKESYENLNAENQEIISQIQQDVNQLNNENAVLDDAKQVTIENLGQYADALIFINCNMNQMKQDLLQKSEQISKNSSSGDIFSLLKPSKAEAALSESILIKMQLVLVNNIKREQIKTSYQLGEFK